MIRVACDTLQAKETSLRTMSVDCGLALQHQFNAGPVDTSYQHLKTRWDEKQVELTSAMDQIAGVLQSIRQAFEEAERQLTLGLNGETL